MGTAHGAEELGLCPHGLASQAGAWGRYIGPLILQKFFVLFCFVFYYRVCTTTQKTTIEKNGVIWGAYRCGERVVLSHF